MTVFNNLNQLLSHVKTLFGLKVIQEEKHSESSPQASLVSDQRLQTALSEVEKCLADNCGTASSAFTYKEYTNGVSLESKAPTF